MSKDSGQLNTGFSASWVNPYPPSGSTAKNLLPKDPPPRVVKYDIQTDKYVEVKPGEAIIVEDPKQLAILPNDYNERKQMRLWEFFFNYFPLAWLEVYKVSEAGNVQHEIGKSLTWDRSKSTDQLNTAFRHLFDYGTGNGIDSDGTRHLAKAIWRLMAQLQLDVENGKTK